MYYTMEDIMIGNASSPVNDLFFPVELLVRAKYFEMSMSSKVLYSFLYSVILKSDPTKTIEEDGVVRLEFSREFLARYLSVSTSTIKRSLLELSEYNLVDEVRRGLGKTNLIYLKKIERL